MQTERNIVLLIYRSSESGFYERTMSALEDILDKKDYRVMKHSLSEKNAYSTLEAVLAPVRKQICLVFSFDMTGYEIPSFGDDFWMNTMPCLCVSYLTKHPVCFREHLRREWGWNILIHCSLKEHRDYIEKRFPGIEEPECFELYTSFCQLSGTGREETGREEAYYREKLQALPEVFQGIAVEMLREMEAGMPADSALEKVCRARQISLSEEEFEALLEELLLTEAYASYHKKKKEEKISMEAAADMVEGYLEYLLALEAGPEAARERIRCRHADHS